MHDMTDEERKAILGEAFMDELKAIREGIDQLNGLPAQVQSIDDSLVNVENDVKAIKIAVKGQSKQLRKHEKQLS